MRVCMYVHVCVHLCVDVRREGQDRGIEKKMCMTICLFCSIIKRVFILPFKDKMTCSVGVLSSPSLLITFSLSFLILTTAFTSAFTHTTTSNTYTFTLPPPSPLPSLYFFTGIYLYLCLHLCLHSTSFSTSLLLEPLISMKRLYGKSLKGLRLVLKVKEKAELMSLPQHGQNPQRLYHYLMI